MSETTPLKDGDEIRLLGSGGAPVLLTVGRPFSAQEIQQKLGSGEWRHDGDEPQEPTAGPQPRNEKLSKPSDDPGPGPKPRTEKLSKPSKSPEPGSPQPRTEHLSKPGQRPEEEAPAPDQRRPACLLYTSPSPRDGLLSRMPSSA